LTCGVGCDWPVTGRCPDDAGSADATPIEAGSSDSGSADAGNLQWYTTCGYPVCGAPEDAGAVDAGPACPAAGSPCTMAGQQCGVPTVANCGVTLVCAPQDPKHGPGGCPISSKVYKDGIEYVGPEQLQQLHDQALDIRLATYRYKPQVGDPTPMHLGFIVEDNLQSPAVDPVHNRVDMYGYLSMIVAGLQVQQKQIEQLRSDLADARINLAACKPAPMRASR
jgi:hypothetical protein